MKSNSWIIVSKKTGKPLFETFNEKIKNAINLEAYEVLTSYEWLVWFNKSVKGE